MADCCDYPQFITTAVIATIRYSTVTFSRLEIDGADSRAYSAEATGLST